MRSKLQETIGQATGLVQFMKIPETIDNGFK